MQVGYFASVFLETLLRVEYQMKIGLHVLCVSQMVFETEDNVFQSFKQKLDKNFARQDKKLF